MIPPKQRLNPNEFGCWAVVVTGRTLEVTGMAFADQDIAYCTGEQGVLAVVAACNGTVALGRAEI